MDRQAFSGLRVLDLGHYVAGPYCSKLFAGLGAEVIKIERPGEGDGARRVGPFPGDLPHPEKSALFLYLNTSKKSVTLNLKTPTGVKILKELVRDVDVLAENFEPRVMPSLGLAHETLAEANPRLVMTSITNYGSSGPYRDYRGTSLTNYAAGGYLHQSGEPDREPLQGPGPQPEYAAALHAFAGTVAALCCREATGLGQHVEVSIMESLAGLHQNSTVLWSYANLIRPRCGNNWFGAHPLTIYRCADSWIATHSGNPTVWEDFCHLIGRPELLTDPRFATGGDRHTHARELDAEILPWVRAHTAEEIFQTLQALRVPWGLVPTVPELLQDPQYRAREFWQEIGHPEAGVLTYPGAPFKMGETPWSPGRAPLLGEHNEEVLCGRLGYTRQELAALRSAEIV